MGPLARALQQAPGDGWRAQLAFVATRVKSKLMNLIGFHKELRGMIVTTDSVNVESATHDSDYSCRFMTAEELWRVADDAIHQMSSEFIGDALGRGDRCFGIFDGDRVASYGWYASKPPNRFNDELDVVFDPGWVFMYKGYTLPEYRGRKLHALGMARALAAVTDEGHEGLISCVEAVNGASLRSCDRMGYQIFGTVKICKWVADDRLRLGPLSAWRIRASSGCTPYGFDVVMAQPEPVL